MYSEVLMQQLEYLVSLAREKHFGRAATSCNVSQPTLSVAIRRLESELGVVIVLRGHRFEGFTAEGGRVVTWAHRILAERDEMLADVARMRGRLHAKARLGAIPTSVPVSPLLTSRFLRSNPVASVRVEALSSREVGVRIANFEIDAGLTYLDEETPSGTKCVELYRERYVLLAPAAAPIMSQDEIPWSQAAKMPLCALTPEMRNRRIIDGYMTADGARFHPVVEADTLAALFAHLAGHELATVAPHTWLHAFGVPPGLAARPMAQTGDGPAVGLVVLDRDPNSIMADALVSAATEVDFAGVLQSTLDGWLSASSRPD